MDLVIPAPEDIQLGKYTIPELDRKHAADQKAVNEAAIASWHLGQ